jgi:hypothetical protein
MSRGVSGVAGGLLVAGADHDPGLARRGWIHAAAAVCGLRRRVIRTAGRGGGPQRRFDPAVAGHGCRDGRHRQEEDGGGVERGADVVGGGQPAAEEGPDGGNVYLEYTDDLKDSVPKYIQLEAEGNRGYKLDVPLTNPAHAQQQRHRQGLL